MGPRRKASSNPRIPRKKLLSLRQGYGALLQRDYWGVIHECRLKPTEVAELVRRRFPEFAPGELVRFARADGSDAPLEVGDEMEVHIRMAGKFSVRVVHRDGNSITLGTVEGHPEAGRITFGSYRNTKGDVVFHIRSIARSSAPKFYAGFLALGEAMQTNTWTDFVNCVGMTAGKGIKGFIAAETAPLRGEEEARRVAGEDEAPRPTFVAKGD